VATVDYNFRHSGACPESRWFLHLTDTNLDAGMTHLSSRENV
jgi:hypothetical protein